MYLKWVYLNSAAVFTVCKWNIDRVTACENLLQKSDWRCQKTILLCETISNTYIQNLRDICEYLRVLASL